MQKKNNSLEAFLGTYTACPSEQQRQNALDAAMKVLTRPASQAEPLLNLKEIANHYAVDESTAWRWELPSHDWRGMRRYVVSECDAYLLSKKFKARRIQLRQQRKEARAAKEAGHE